MPHSPTSFNCVDLDESGENGTENVEISPKINAFQFMMNNRHKSIGRNSPGREIDLNESSTGSTLANAELKIRNGRLERWAERKGALKRKREYEEIGDTISHKLKARGKRLKKLLKIHECQSDDEVIVKKKKQMKDAVIETDSENSTDAHIEEKRRKVNKEKKRTELNINLTPKNNKMWKIKMKHSKDIVKSDNSVEQKSEIELLSKRSKSQNEIDCNDCVVLITEDTDVNNENKRVLRSRRSRPKNYQDFFSDEEGKVKIKKSKNAKKKPQVAPVFLNAIPKPKIDPQVAEARRQFLLSGIPSSLKKEMERQQSAEETKFDVFPTISHVQQKSLNNSFWELPKVSLATHPSKVGNIETKSFTRQFIDISSEAPREETKLPPKLKNYKKIIKEIKSQNPDYPVYKILNSFNKNQRKSQNSGVPTKADSNTLQWTDKYSPNSANTIGNHSAISSLKQWLTNYVEISKTKKRKYDSESEFCFDNDSCDDRPKTNSDTLILRGPTGSGKTAAVYAVCSELGLKVIEVNASTKRTGKRLVQELQEATQSHQVRKNTSALSFAEEKCPEPNICVLLVEDVDVVFEQDEGFLSALSQIMVTSKRPIILTMTDGATTNLQKIINDYEIINFSPFSSILTIWLQIVCLMEGYYVNCRSIEELLSYFRGDIRRTLLQLQVYVSSGGKLSRNEISNKIEIEAENGDFEDDVSNLSYLTDDSNDNNVEIHVDCLHVGNIVGDYSDLGMIWWNLPVLLNFPSFANSRLDRSLKFETEEIKDVHKIRTLLDCYESLAFADVFCSDSQYHESLERRWRRPKVKDGLCLEENFSSYEDKDFRSALAQRLVDGTIRMYTNQDCINVAVPTAAERRWRSKQLSVEEKLQEAVPHSDILNRKSLALDYMAFLRNIARGDGERAAKTTKRGKRYDSHLKNLGVRCGEATCKVASDIFKLWH